MDRYKNFEELRRAEREGVDFRIVVEERVGARAAVIAPHGGGIEPGTSEIARALAGDDCSLGLFEGLKLRGNSKLHVTSTNFDEPRIRRLAVAARTVITVHGESSADKVAYVGGRDQRSVEEILSSLRKAGFAAQEHDDPQLQGTAPDNICNCGSRGCGVQLELARELRKSFFKSLSVDGRRQALPELRRFVEALKGGLIAAGAL